MTSPVAPKHGGPNHLRRRLAQQSFGESTIPGSHGKLHGAAPFTPPQGVTTRSTPSHGARRFDALRDPGGDDPRRRRSEGWASPTNPSKPRATSPLHPVTLADDLGPRRVRAPTLRNVRRVVTLRRAKSLGRRRLDQRLVDRTLHMARPRTVTSLALHVLQLVDVRHRGPARLIVAGHVTPHALEVELLELPIERRVRLRVARRVPELALLGVTGGANLDTHVARLRLRQRASARGP